MIPLSGPTKYKFDWFKERERQLEAEAAEKKGLPRHEWWRFTYYKFPYLLFASDDAIRERFVDLFANMIDLNRDGKIVPTPMMMNEGRFAQIFTELIEETNSRGILTKDVIADAAAPIKAYFANGEPLGQRMFGTREHLSGQWLVKYSKRKFVDEMYKFGRFRISPASEYSRGSYLKAIKDFETAHDFKLKALREALDGTDELVVQNIPIKITDGFVPIQYSIQDYYLFSTCKEIDRRMPTDFEADAALIIKDRRSFISKLKAATLKDRAGWEFLDSEVYYFDPYNDVPTDPNQEFWKHFSFFYQKEHRCVLRSKWALPPGTRLQPFFVELGSLEEMSEVVTA